MARFAVVTSFFRPRGWMPAAAEGTADFVAPRWRIAWPSWSPPWQMAQGLDQTDATCFLLSAVIHMLRLRGAGPDPDAGHAPASRRRGRPSSPRRRSHRDDRPELIRFPFRQPPHRAAGRPEQRGAELTRRSSARRWSSTTTRRSSSRPAAAGSRRPTGAATTAWAGPTSGASASGRLIHGRDGVGRGLGEGDMPGAGGSGFGFGQRGKGSSTRHRRNPPGGTRGGRGAWIGSTVTRAPTAIGASRSSAPAAAAASVARAPGQTVNDAAATALGLLPFLAAGQTHKEKCTYQATVNRAITWLVKHQLGDGDLSGGREQIMYSHALATIALVRGLRDDQGRVAPRCPRRPP